MSKNGCHHAIPRVAGKTTILYTGRFEGNVDQPLETCKVDPQLSTARRWKSGLGKRLSNLRESIQSLQHQQCNAAGGGSVTQSLTSSGHEKRKPTKAHGDCWAAAVAVISCFL